MFMSGVVYLRFGCIGPVCCPHYRHTVFLTDPAEVTHGFHDLYLWCQLPPKGCEGGVCGSLETSFIAGQLVLHPDSLLCDKICVIQVCAFSRVYRNTFVILEGSNCTSSRLYPGLRPGSKIALAFTSFCKNFTTCSLHF